MGVVVFVLWSHYIILTVSAFCVLLIFLWNYHFISIYFVAAMLMAKRISSCTTTIPIYGRLLLVHFVMLVIIIIYFNLVAVFVTFVAVAITIIIIIVFKVNFIINFCATTSPSYFTAAATTAVKILLVSCISLYCFASATAKQKGWLPSHYEWIYI